MPGRASLCRKRSGFTLLEIVAVLIIVAILAGIGLAPTLTTSMEMAHAQDAQTNLMAIYAAQKNYFNNNGLYYSSSTSPDDTAGINTALGLNVISNGWYYTCPNQNTCYAKRMTDSNFYLDLSLYLPVVLTVSPPTGPNPNPEPNPYCINNSHPAYCVNAGPYISYGGGGPG